MHLSAHAEAGLERFRAAFAANAHVSDEKLLRQPRLPLRRPPMNGAAVHRASRPREKEPPPKLSRQYARATSTLVLRDQRLTPNAARLAGMIVAIAGQRGWFETTRARLGAAIGLRPRTVTRLLAGLQRYGYITMERTKTRTGAHAGLRIIVMPRLMPFYVFENQAWPGGARDVKTQDFQEGPNLPKGVPSKPADRAWG